MQHYCLIKASKRITETGLTSVAMGTALEIFVGFIVIGLLSGVVTSLLVNLRASRRRPRRKGDRTSAIPPDPWLDVGASRASGLAAPMHAAAVSVTADAGSVVANPRGPEMFGPL
jgi:energy-converting hydrogenase Eha subunit A